MSGKSILVTGGTSGIGLALCKQLAADHKCRVFLGARNVEKGQAAISGAGAPAPPGALELVHLEVTDEGSIASAVDAVKEALGPEKLYGLVNNAGVHPRSGYTDEQVLDINFKAPRKIFDAFLPLLDPEEGRVVNLGSGGGPNYVQGCPPEVQKVLCNEPESLEELEKIMMGPWGLGSGSVNSYGLSKALLSCYTMLMAREHPSLTISCCSPGYINTNMTAGWGATKTPEEGTTAIKHCLLGELGGSGWYYGSDAVRSPYHFMRNPGEPEYDGKSPY